MVFHLSRPAKLVSGSLKFLLSSLLLSKATVSAPSDVLVHVHLLSLLFSTFTLSICYLTIAHIHLTTNQEDKFLSVSPILPSSTCRCGPTKYYLMVQIYNVFPHLCSLPLSSNFQIFFQLTFLSMVSALSLSPTMRVRQYSLQCHFCSNLR